MFHLLFCSRLVRFGFYIAVQRGTNEQRRQNELVAERLRLEKRIAEIQQQYGDSEQAQELIKLEEENSAIAQCQPSPDHAVPGFA
ncbi:MAG: hypothetical protein QNJ55_34870 [Xenococcus sp. MO_188.B8]|nr:hypothetical protein [Xenococcus sp. MO_188.B8]